jgi:hypothetical protein
MTSAKIKSVPLPASSALCAPTVPYDYADSYAAVLPDSSMSAPDAAWDFFGQAPRWVGTLMRMRNSFVSLFGLKTGQSQKPVERRALVPGQKVGLFRIYSASPTEVILGEDDRHLNFRVSVLVEPGDQGKKNLVVSTVVHYQNRWGQMYFFFVRPFHRIIVPAMFRRMITRLAA